MRPDSKSPGVFIAGLLLGAALMLIACAEPVSATNQENPVAGAPKGLPTATWTPDNGNGTFTNPLFYDEFSDPDLIRVGDWFYLTGTTMHAMPGVPILRSKDLVNWEFVAYVLDKLDLGPAYRQEGGGNIYGQGIWAPFFRYHEGKFYIFANVNGQMTQMFTATDPKGSWTRTSMKRSLHDLSVLFDDDGKAYITVDKDGAVTLTAGQSGTAQTFQWIETPTGELALMSLASNRFLRIVAQLDGFITIKPHGGFVAVWRPLYEHNQT